MNADMILIDLFVNQADLQESLKALRLITLLNGDPALKQLIDLLKIIDNRVDTERAKIARSREMERVQHQRQKEEMTRMMEEAKQAKPWDSGAPCNSYPSIKGIPDIYTSGTSEDALKSKPSSLSGLEDLVGNWPGKF